MDLSMDGMDLVGMSIIDFEPIVFWEVFVPYRLNVRKSKLKITLLKLTTIVRST